jgi:predicted transcriptional regulator
MGMKRDSDLIREILLEIEEHPGPDGQLIRLKIADHAAAEISYHIGLLKEAGLINAVVFSGDDQRTWYATGMTMQGHEYLDAIRDDTRWNQLKKALIKAGASLPLAIDLLSKFLGRS